MPTNGKEIALLKQRVTTIERNYDKMDTKIDTLDGKIDKLMSNDLPHLAQDMVSLKARVTALTAVNIGALLIAIIVSRYIP